MPLYYFDIYDGVSGLDRVGKECFDCEAARQEASRHAARLLADEEDWFSTGQEWQIGVMDTDGASIFSLDFRISTDVLITTWNSSARREPCAGIYGFNSQASELSLLGRARDSDRRPLRPIPQPRQ